MKDRAIILLVLCNFLLCAGLGYALFFREPVNAQAQSQRKWTSLEFSDNDQEQKQLLARGYEPFAAQSSAAYGVRGFVAFRK